MIAFIRQIFDPKAPPPSRWWGAVCIAALVTLFLRVADSRVAERNSREYGVLIARQLASAAEGLVLAAQQKNISEPAHWAISYLSQGVEPRLIQISKERTTSEELNENARPGVVEYRKPFALTGKDAGTGIRILVTLPRAGFLGATTPLKRDAATFAVFVFLTGFFGLALSIRAQNYTRQQFEARQKRLGTIVPELREVLLAIGKQLKDIFGRFEELGNSSTEAHQNVVRARTSYHQSLQAVRKAIQAIHDLNGHGLHVEAATLNMMVQSGRQDPDSALLSARLAHEQLLDMRHRQQSLQKLLLELERKLEPVATDLDLSFHAMQQTEQTLREVPAEIQRTGERMTAQARIFQTIRQELQPSGTDC
ncbi:MAG: hypothetical protein ACK5QT_04460 [Oligoflexia bacterium]